LPIPNGTLTLIDESYNANPASMRAALTLLGDMNVKGRRIAILGDMLELGPQSADLHQGLIDSILANKIDLVFASGPMMKHLYDALPASLKGEWVAEAQALVSVLTKTVKAGDALMIKGSNGSRMGPVVAKLKEIFTPEQTIAD
jgi:UDP-N-acetylmuramoyl-tripeptide--D-alanyl-D-alanine ligase